MLHAELLGALPLFDTLSREDCEALASRLTERRYAANEIVFSKGDSGSSMYIVLSGGAEIFLPQSSEENNEQARVVLKEVRTGEYFGELSLFDDKPRSASVVATVDTVLLELKREEFADHIGSSRTAAMSILAEMAERLRETNAMLSQRAAKDVVKELEENLTWGERLADRVASLNGSWSFILLLLGLTVAWAGINIVVNDPFDAYPYVFFNLLLAILVALQGPLIVMSQNRQSTKDRAQADTDYRVNLKNEVNIENLLREMGAMRGEVQKRLEALERHARADRIKAEIPIKKPGGPLTRS